MSDQIPLVPCMAPKSVRPVDYPQPTYKAILFRQNQGGKPIKITDEPFFNAEPLGFEKAIEVTSIILKRLLAETETVKSEPIPGNKINVHAYNVMNRKLPYFFILIRQTGYTT